MRKTQIVAGERYARLLTIREALPEERLGDRPTWLCQCDCGKLTFTRSSHLVSGNTKSCGCLKEEIKAKIVKLGEENPGFKHGKYGTLTYHRWQNMMQRCYSPSSKDELYQTKGITVCERWRVSFKAFLEDMGECPSATHTLDRLNNARGYGPDNCRWATPKEQARNRTTNLLIEGVPASQLAEELGIPYSKFHRRYKRGYRGEELRSKSNLPGRTTFPERRKFTAEQVLEIRSRAAKGESPYHLGKAFGVSERSIRGILEGRCYKDV